MRSIKIVRLQKYGLFGLGLKRSPNWAPMVPQKRVIRAQFGAGGDEVLWRIWGVSSGIGGMFV